MARSLQVVGVLGLVFLAGLAAGPLLGAPLPENLAPKARATATSEHNQSYLAKFAIDGKVPAAGSNAADLGAAWCVLKAKSRHGRPGSNVRNPPDGRVIEYTVPGIDQG